MIRLIRPAVALFMIAVLLLNAAPSRSYSAASDMARPESSPATAASVPGQLLVRFRSVVPDQRAEAIVAAEASVRLGSIPALGVVLLALPQGRSVQEAAERFSSYPEVEYAEPNYLLYVAQMEDPGLENQWAPQQIDAPEAWAITGGDPETVIAVVDTGIDYRHTELAPNIWANADEQPGNGVDDDGNGYVDDTRGWDFVNADADPLDDHSHGTHVAGIAAAAANANPDGLVGVCPACTLMPVKVLDASGSGSLDAVANGIVYAADNGAKVVNLSLGATVGMTTLESAVDYAWSHGVVVVAAAGNDGTETLFYPAAYANAIAVASTNDHDQRSCFSNYSAGFISVAAPGEGIYSTLPLDAGGNDSYGTYSGTSMATPHVSGLAGLLFSVSPQPTNAQVRDLIESTTEDLGPTGTDAYFGTGRINAFRAVTGDSTPTIPPTGGLYTDSTTASGYAHARKLARGADGRLYLVWHGQDGGLYRVLYATSSDHGATWSPPEVVFGSTAETYHPALALDGSYVYVAFPSKDGAARYRVFFTRKELAGGDWSLAVPLIGGSYDAVRPDLFVDPSNGRLHLVASSLDNADYVYYTSSQDQGLDWSSVVSVNPSTPTTSSRTRYATVHASGSNVYVAARTLATSYLLTTYYLHTVRSTDGGQTWFDQTKISSYLAILTGEYGVSLAGVGDRLYMAYEVGGGLYFRRWDGSGWSNYLQLESTSAWPTITQADDGQAWLLWESGDDLLMRHYTGTEWEPAELVADGTALGRLDYPNLKLGTSGGRIEWVATHCSGAPFRLLVDGRSVELIPTPTPSPTDTPTPTPTHTPTPTPTDTPTPTPSDTPTPTPTDTPTPTPTFTPTPGPSMHVGDLDAGAVDVNRKFWQARVTVMIHDVGGLPLAAATVTGLWSDGYAGTATCITDSSGQCAVVTNNISKLQTTVLFTVTDVTHASYLYKPTANHDPDGDSNGTSITVDLNGPPAPTPTPTATPTALPGQALHVGDLDGRSDPAPRSRWNATVLITIHDTFEAAMPGATVEGTWSIGGTSSCITDAGGRCSVLKANLKSTVPSVIWTVTNVIYSGYRYEVQSNHDPDHDSNGTSITVNQ